MPKQAATQLQEVARRLLGTRLLPVSNSLCWVPGCSFDSSPVASNHGCSSVARYPVAPGCKVVHLATGLLATGETGARYGQEDCDVPLQPVPYIFLILFKFPRQLALASPGGFRLDVPCARWTAIGYRILIIVQIYLKVDACD